MNSPLTQRPGAVADQSAPVAAHYGSPSREYRALIEGRALTDLSHWEVVAVTGPQRLEWLTVLSTQALADLEPGIGTQALWLDPQGRIQHYALVCDSAQTTYLVTGSGRSQGLKTYLESMIFRYDVEVSAPDLAALGGYRPLEAGVVNWRDPWPEIAPGSTRYGPETSGHPGAQTPLHIALIKRENLEAETERLETTGLGLAGHSAWEAARVETWRPWEPEIDARALPHELDWLRTTTHLQKGCYRGQEAVARIINLGKPPRRLTMLHLGNEHESLPEPATPVELDPPGPRPVGHVTTAVRHPELGNIALALIKRNTPLAAQLRVRVGEGELFEPATQEEITNPHGNSTARPDPVERPELLQRRSRR